MKGFPSPPYPYIHNLVAMTTGNDKYVKFPAPLGQPCVLYDTKKDIGRRFVENLRNRKIL